MKKGTLVTRRFVITRTAVVGGGLAIGFATPSSQSALAKRSASDLASPELNAWLVVKPDDSIIVRVARSEMGQGSSTGLAQLVVEELDCDWSKVTIEFPTPSQNLERNRIWGDFATTASRSIRTSHEFLRQAGAGARLMLIAAAAQLWKAPALELTTDKGVVSHEATKRSITYGRLATAAAKLDAPDPRQIKLKPAREWKVIGQPLKRLDTAEKLTGKTVFGIDIRLPGLLSAAIRDAAVFGARVKNYDATAVLEMPGVRHVMKVGDTAVAVVADTWWQAKKGLDALPVEWDESPDRGIDTASIAAYLKEGLDAKQAFIGQAHGDALKAISGATKRLEAVYATPFLHHATLEPMNCTARWTPEGVEVWVGTQNGDAALRAAAEAAGLPIELTEVHKCQVGGGFGRRSRQDYVTQAVLIAKQVPGTPVKLIWSREEDTTHSFYRPVTQCKLIGGLDEKGDLQGLIVRISGQSIVASQIAQTRETGKDARMFMGLYAESGEAQIGYSIPNLYIDHAMRNTHVPVGSWRGVHVNQNAIYLECFIDELARASGKDPLDFRRAMMKSHPKHQAALVAATEKADWSNPPPLGIHRGLAQCMSYGSYSAAVAEISVSDEGIVKVHRIVLALDPGYIVNPDQVAAQIEGSVAFALSAIFHQEITIKEGAVVERDFNTYNVIRIDEMPVIEPVLVPSGEFWGGVGEAAIAVVAPAVLNAIFAATGTRVRTLPLKNVKLL